MPDTDGIASANAAADGPGGNTAANAPCADCPTHFVKIRLVDEDGLPIGDEPFVIVTPDGTEVQGLTDAKGFGEARGIPAGECTIRFTALDSEVWERK